LNETEVRILLLCVLGRTINELGLALENIGNLNDQSIAATLSVLLDEDMDDVADALKKSSVLAQSGLLKLDSSGSYSFRGKIDLLDGVADRLFAKHGSSYELFADNFVKGELPQLKVSDFDYMQSKVEQVSAYLRHALNAGMRGINILIYGSPGTGKTQLSRLLAAGAEAQLFEVAVCRAQGERISGAQRLSAYALSQRILAKRQRTVLLFDEVEDISEETDDDDDMSPFRRKPSFGKAWFNQMLESNAVPAIFITNRPNRLDRAHRRRFDIQIQMDVPPASVRARMLRDMAAPLGVSDAWCERLSQHDEIGPAILTRATRVAQVMREAGVAAPAEALCEDLIRDALKAQGQDGNIAPLDTSELSYEIDLVRADFNLNGLVEGLKRHRQGRLCFYGPPGTGKSALARHIAQRVGCPAMVKRTSDLLSPFVGESEQRVAQAFEAATQSGSVLIIDEADSLLSSRSQGEKKTWEVSLVNEFLQQMEAYRGILITTTNLLDRLDEASMRRFDAKIEFKALDERQRIKLLQRTCEQMGLSQQDLEQHARRLNTLTPGDVSTVVRQSRLNPISDVADLASRLAREESFKSSSSSRPIGFWTVQ
jgi:transitional endoplasmic reticulum ATPase